MSDARPHLRIEQPREQSTRVYEGGGGGTYPRTSYESHSRKIFAEAEQMRAFFASREDSSATNKRYFKVVLPIEKKVSTSEGTHLADHLHSKIVGSHSSYIAHLSSTTDSLNLLSHELRRYAEPGSVGRSKFAVIEDISSIPWNEKLSTKAVDAIGRSADRVDVLIGLFPDLSHVERLAIVQAMRVWIEAKNGALLSATDVESGMYLRVSALPATVREAAESFMSVQSVDPVEYVLDISSRPGAALESAIQVLPNIASATSAIFDSGVVPDSRFIDASIIGRESPHGTPFNVDHGTFVASRIIFGDTLRNQVAAGRLSPDVKVLSVCTIVADDIGNRRPTSTEQMMRLIRDTVARWHRQIRVYNISQNLFPTDPTVDPTISDDVVSPLAAELDKLARRYRVLFVVTAGNYPQPGAPTPLQAYPDYFATPLTRIVAPAESVLALTIGSVAERGGEGSLAPAGHPSPFTRKGPGFAKFCKPDLVAHGGNFGSQWHHVDDLAAAGIGNHGDRLSYGSGTSYAAPLVTRLAAKLFEAIPDATPELVRALLIHFAQVSSAMSQASVSDLVGHGLPDASRLLSSTQWEQTFVHVGVLPYREIRRVAFYVPKALCSRRGRKLVRVRVTLAYAPETDRTLKRGYCKSHVRCKLAKLDASGSVVEVGASACDKVAKDRYASIARIEKTFSSHVSGGEWVLIIEHESRWNLVDAAMPVAVVITVEDPKRDPAVDILAQIRSEVPTMYSAQLAAPTTLRI